MKGFMLFTALLFGRGILVSSQNAADCKTKLSQLPVTELGAQAVYPKDFNFHDKNLFLKGEVQKLTECITKSLDSGCPVPFPDTLKKDPDPKTGGFVFEYNGTRGYEESCLGDGYKRDILHRLYDGGCVSYEDKIDYLSSFSCNASQNLECRQTGEEPFRQFAEQATPIMKCLCPDYNTSQTYIKKESQGYYDKKMRKCVLKVGQICKIRLQGLDARTKWKDEDFNDNGNLGISVSDRRPIPKSYPCVKNSFCYLDGKDNNGLHLDELYKNRCVCKKKHFETADGECQKRLEDTTTEGLLLALMMILIAITTFYAGLMKY